MPILPQNPRKCQLCGKPFSPKNNRHTLCSNECRNKEKLNNRSRFVPEENIKPCAYCGKEFIPNLPGTKYCTKECAKEKLSLHQSVEPYRIYERDDFRCMYCGKSSIEDGIKLNADHIYPRSKGGEDIAGNLATACEKCNTSKHNKILSEEVSCRLLRIVEERNKSAGISPNLVIKR